MRHLAFFSQGIICAHRDPFPISCPAFKKIPFTLTLNSKLLGSSLKEGWEGSLGDAGFFCFVFKIQY